MVDRGLGFPFFHLSPSSEEESAEHSPDPSLASLSGNATYVNGGGASSSPSTTKHGKSSLSNEYRTLGGIDGSDTTGHQIFPTSKRPRGRPPGSKNKPKPPVVITKENEHAIKPTVFEISAGSDVVEALVQFARRHHVGISVQSGSGTISNVTLRHPVSHAPAFTLNGPFTLLSLAGSYISSPNFTQFNDPYSSSPSNTPSAISWPASSSFAICVSGSQGQMFGGAVGGKVIAASPVRVVAMTFKNPSFHRVFNNEGDEAEGPNPFDGVASSENGNFPIEGGSSNSNNNNAMHIPTFNVASQAPLSSQLPADVMPWGHSIRPPNY